MSWSVRILYITSRSLYIGIPFLMCLFVIDFHLSKIDTAVIEPLDVSTDHMFDYTSNPS